MYNMYRHRLTFKYIHTVNELSLADTDGTRDFVHQIQRSAICLLGTHMYLVPLCFGYFRQSANHNLESTPVFTGPSTMFHSGPLADITRMILCRTNLFYIILLTFFLKK